MTSAAGLRAVRESLELALLVNPDGDSEAIDLAEAAVEHYSLNYSRHAPQLLFDEVRRTRLLLSGILTRRAGATMTDLQRQVGWLSALLGNLAYHLGDGSGARTHLGTATTYGTWAGDTRLVAWAWGARSMMARAAGQFDAAFTAAEHGVAAAPSGLVRAQLSAWALLRSAAVLGRVDVADEARSAALRDLDADPAGWAPGRFGFDAAEMTLHQAEADLALGRAGAARALAEQSVAACSAGTPGWAAATLVLAQAEAPDFPTDAAQRAADVLDQVPPERLRSTARTRLRQLDEALGGNDATGVGELRERIRDLPPLAEGPGEPSVGVDLTVPGPAARAAAAQPRRSRVPILDVYVLALHELYSSPALMPACSVGKPGRCLGRLPVCGLFALFEQAMR
ncbi:hypothetical protein ACGF5C_27375 [Micromonospora sp. NPDC047620]|uniref:hypothetical protein n=1 Tax=Micromonospora sp. NPDC047620 TaxID=3364251 RepID=UPI0037102FA9